MSRLFLLDGMALVYRAHFAFIQNPIRTSQGLNTSALYGFINTLLTILENEKPTHLGVAFDTSAPTPRHIKFPAYKAQRDAMPEELAAAIPHVKRLCTAFHIPVLELDGFEADDIIGTLARRAETDGFETFMVTPDKDFAQLVTPAISMWKPGRKGSEHEVMDLPAVLKHWEIERPSQVIDILGLWGDASDNIPGVPGVGEKTAKKLIAQFGSIENLLEHTAELKGKQRETFEANRDQALLSKDLATIITDVPVEVTWNDLSLHSRDDDAIRAIFTEFEFRTLTRRLFGDAAAAATTKSTVAAEDGKEAATAPVQPTLFETFRTIRDTPHEYHLIETPEAITAFAAELTKQATFCFDIETTSLDRFEAELLGIAFSWKAGEGYFVAAKSLADLEPLLPILTGSAEKIGHNLKYDLCVLHNLGLPVAGPFFDTMLADSLVAPERRHTMDYLSEALLGYTPVKLSDLEPALSDEVATHATTDDDLFAFAEKKTKGGKKELNMRAIPLAALAEYAAEDADVTFQLAEKIRPLLAATGQENVFAQLESPLLPVLVRMEMEGIAVDQQALGEVSESLQQRIEALGKSIEEHAGRRFNLNSPKQLGEVLFDELKLLDKAKKTKTGQYKTDEQTLATLAGSHPIIDEILSFREATKLKGTYLDALPKYIVGKTNRIHTHYHQLVAATGRLASSDPNLQNIPVRSEAGREIRKAFVPRGPGFTLLSADYSQIELRVMAAVANDASMIEDFRNDRDIHTATAARVFGVADDAVTSDMRRTAKMVNFGIIYGISAFGLSQRLGIPRGDAATIIDTYFQKYPAIRAFMDNTIQQAREDGHVTTLCGRRRTLPDLASSNQNVRGNAERAAINTPIQGTAADMIKKAMIDIDALLRDGSYKTRMLLQVHDELVFDLALDEQEALVPKILDAMRNALPLPGGVPIQVEAGTGSNWLAAH